MSRRGIGSLGLPPGKFRVDRGAAARRCGFETIGQSRSEDRLRAKGLKRVACKRAKWVDAGKALALAAKLECAGAGGDVPESLASSTFMQGLRIKVTAAMWRLIRKAGVRNVRGFTIIPGTWEVDAEGLAQEDPRKRMRALRAALYSVGAKTADGWMIAFIHGEWDPIGEVYRLHVHGFAYGGMVDVIDRLRELPNYKTQRRLKDGSLSPVYRRVRVSRKKLRRLPFPITYRLQSYWPAKALIISDDGSRIRARRKGRISEPFHSQLLLWLDRWRIEDLTLMIGLRVTKDGLRQTKLVS